MNQFILPIIKKTLKAWIIMIIHESRNDSNYNVTIINNESNTLNHTSKMTSDEYINPSTTSDTTSPILIRRGVRNSGQVYTLHIEFRIIPEDFNIQDSMLDFIFDFFKTDPHARIYSRSDSSCPITSFE